MTDKSRELLEQVIAEADSSHFYSSEIDKEIRAYLAQPEVKREPMTYDEAEAGFYSTFLGCTVFDHFMAGVLFTEKHHGISSTIPLLNDTISANSRDLGHE